MKKLCSSIFGPALFLIVGCAFHTSAQSSSADRPDGAAVNSIAETSESALPTIFIAGDSTAARSSSPIQQGWAVPFANYFDPTKVRVVNRARGGRSSRTFITEGLWDRLLANVKRDDIVLIQFGHNDGGPINDDRRARGSIRGLGGTTQEIDNLLTGNHEVVHTYGWYLRKMIADTKARGAIPIVLSLTIRNIWNDGKVEHGSGRYGEWAEAVAREAGVYFVDLSNLMADEFQVMGEERMKAFYEQDHTHFNPEGADLHARFVVRGLKELPGQLVAGYLSEAGEAVKASGGSWNRGGRIAPRVGPVHAGFNPALPTLWVIGDSTVKNGRDDGGDGLWGWGNPIGAYFDRQRINIENQALGGTSSRSFLTLKLWEAVRVRIKPGDYVIMQFGHNDGGGAYDDNRARKSIRGSGDDTVEVNLRENGMHELVHTYGWYLREYIDDTKARGATPIICSLIPRNDWTNGKVRRAGNSYGEWAREAAEAGNALFINLNSLIADRYDALGKEAVKPFFPREHTHTGWDGAVLNAECVIKGIQALHGCDLSKYLLANPEPPKEP